jgi:membrane associated rhomboid family serine protease
MSQVQNTGFNIMPPVVKNLLIINGLMFLAATTAETTFGFNLNWKLGLFYPESPLFEPYQLVTHLFMHGNFFHIFSNMFALWMFGSVIENYIGSQRFFIYYFITGIGASLLHLTVNQFEYMSVIDQLSRQDIREVIEEGRQVLLSGQRYRDEAVQQFNMLMNVPTVGASGAVFGVLLAFGYLFPNQRIFIIFFPVPIKAKYFVIGYGVFELYTGLSNPGSNVAHFAHLGGMLFGYITLRLWKRSGYQ